MRSKIDEVVSRASRVILGKPRVVRLSLACLLARGHLLIEDQPGVGKTTLAHLLAQLLGLQYQRIQFTSDLLPADILGVAVFDRERQVFRFHPGPVFSQLVLADEINRATPKAQSALLEAMEERQVTVEGKTRALPEPFFVIATQNPTYQIGTFPLPESQLDRFLMRLEIGYPGPDAERMLLAGEDRRDLLAELQAALAPDELLAAQRQAMAVHVADPILDYCQELLSFSRGASRFLSGLSPRAGLSLLRAAKAWALLEGRDHVIPDDIQAVLQPVVDHRLRFRPESERESYKSASEVLLSSVPVPA